MDALFDFDDDHSHDDTLQQKNPSSTAPPSTLSANVTATPSTVQTHASHFLRSSQTSTSAAKAYLSRALLESSTQKKMGFSATSALPLPTTASHYRQTRAYASSDDEQQPRSATLEEESMSEDGSLEDDEDDQQSDRYYSSLIRKTLRSSQRSLRSSRSSGSRHELHAELSMTSLDDPPTTGLAKTASAISITSTKRVVPTAAVAQQSVSRSPYIEASIEHYGTPREIIVPIRDVDFVTERPPPTVIDLTTASLGLDPASDTPLNFGDRPVNGHSMQHPFKHAALNPAPARKVVKSDFELLRVIGKGAYGKVFLVRKTNGRDQNTLYAMKVLEKAHIVLHAKDTEHTKNERSILEEVRHPFIVRLFYAFQTDAKLYLILDFACGGELFTYLEKEKMLLEDRAVFYLAELVLALEHLHRLGIIYRDLKPENILLDREGHVLLTDFGLSKVALGQDERTNTVCGTVEYMAPEVLASREYDMSVDWWSLGALAFDVMTGSPPFTSNNRKKTIDMVMNKKLTLPYYLSSDAKDLLTKLMRKKASARLGYGTEDAKPIKAHRFFRKIDWVRLYQRGYPPPIVPKLSGPEDVSNFHTAFTNMPVVDSPPVGHHPSPTISAVHPPLNDSEIFSGFSFVASCVLNEHQFEDLYHKRRKPSKVEESQ